MQQQQRNPRAAGGGDGEYNNRQQLKNYGQMVQSNQAAKQSSKTRAQLHLH